MKTATAWISWVLLFGFMVLLGAFIAGWITTTTESQTSDMVDRGYRNIKCEDVGVGITGICQDAQVLNINLTNTERIAIDQIIVRTIDLYGDVLVLSYNQTLLPGRVYSIEVIKQGTTKQLEIIPVVFEYDSLLVCEEKKAVSSEINYCS